jgi:hypothetical protein
MVNDNLKINFLNPNPDLKFDPTQKLFLQSQPLIKTSRSKQKNLQSKIVLHFKIAFSFKKLR